MGFRHRGPLVGLDLPNDGKAYAIRRSDGVAGIVESVGGNGISDSPLDGKTYARRSGAWVEASQPGHAHTPAEAGAAAADHGHGGYQATSEKSQANGYAGLDPGGKVPPVNLGGSGGDASKVLDGTGAWVAKPAGDANGYVTLGADRTNNTTSFADCTGLGFTATAGKTYLVEFLIKFTANATTTGIQLGVAGSAALGALAGDIVGYTAATTIAGRHFNTYNESGKSLSASLAGTNFAVVRCLFTAGASDTALILRFAAEASTTGTSVTIKAGSILRYRQVD